eukprot:7310658-Ditylum_brightwellii.AAC.1
MKDEVVMDAASKMEIASGTPKKEGELLSNTTKEEEYDEHDNKQQIERIKMKDKAIMDAGSEIQNEFTTSLMKLTCEQKEETSAKE